MRHALVLVAMSALAVPAARACELDGLSHGYGPMAALFAGAHRYQSLNGVDEPPPPEVEAEAEAAAPADAPAASPPVGPRRSFVAWAKARPKPDATTAAETPATWARGAMAAEAPDVEDDAR